MAAAKSKVVIARKGARRMSEIPAGVLRELNAGEAESITLVEILAIDSAKLARAAGLNGSDAERIAAAGGIVPRMKEGGRVLFERHGVKGAMKFAEHPSDTVRGWAAFAIAADGGLSLDKRLTLVRRAADDVHSGVREWAWLAVRDAIVADVERALRLLGPWTGERSANLRRFASEATRPRGVWCAHIARLKAEPALGAPLLTALRADDSKYVQDSVGNWLNDASKSDGAWVRGLCARWMKESPTPATTRICGRAMRTLRKGEASDLGSGRTSSGDSSGKKSARKA